MLCSPDFKGLVGNTFTFSKKLYLQTFGVAMGRPAAVAYTNIFMFSVKRHHLSSLIQSSKTFGRYTDDIVTIVDSPHTDLEALLTQLNSAPVSFTAVHSPSSLVALDMLLFSRDGSVATKTF